MRHAFKTLILALLIACDPSTTDETLLTCPYDEVCLEEMSMLDGHGDSGWELTQDGWRHEKFEPNIVFIPAAVEQGCQIHGIGFEHNQMQDDSLHFYLISDGEVKWVTLSGSSRFSWISGPEPITVTPDTEIRIIGSSGKQTVSRIVVALTCPPQN